MTFNKIKMHLCHQKLPSNDNKNKYIKGRNDISRYEPLNLYLNTTYLQESVVQALGVVSGLSNRRQVLVFDERGPEETSHTSRWLAEWLWAQMGTSKAC
ncbi:hypothetical protein NQ317_017445, partial [Molorchus minor]